MPERKFNYILLQLVNLLILFNYKKVDFFNGFRLYKVYYWHFTDLGCIFDAGAAEESGRNKIIVSRPKK